MLLVFGIVGLSFAGWKIARDTADAQSRPLSADSPFRMFDLSSTSIPKQKIHHGGPPVDGIPALSQPQFIAADDALSLDPGDRVIGVKVGDVAKAYPLRILDFHEIVNDRIGTQQFVVTYCPLCDSAIVYDRQVGDDLLEFGVSGLLYNSNVLMYDRRKSGNMSLWSQLQATGISGTRLRQKLAVVPYEVTTWELWRTRYPQSLVLSPETGHARDYSRSPYENYFASPDLMFPVDREDRRLARKARILGLWDDSSSIALPIDAFRDVAEQGEIEIRLGDRPVVVAYDPQGPSLRVVRSDARTQWAYSFWFAWAAFHPETEIFELP